MELRGNATAYTGGTTHRPIPHAGDHQRRDTHAAPAPKKAGIDWDATKPTCKGCGERSGQLGAGALCPTCRGAVPEPKTPTNLTSVGDSSYVTLPAEDVEARFSGDKTPGAFEVFEKPGVGRPRTFDHDEAMRRYALGEPSATIAADLNTKISTLHGVAKRRGISHGQDRVVPLTPQDEPEAVVPPTPPRAADPRENAAPPRPAAPTRTQELDAQINHVTRVLRDTADLDNPAARLLRLNALSAIEALHLFTQMYPQTPAPAAHHTAGSGQTTETVHTGLGGTPEGGDRKGKAARPPVTGQAAS